MRKFMRSMWIDLLFIPFIFGMLLAAFSLYLSFGAKAATTFFRSLRDATEKNAKTEVKLGRR